MGGKETNKHESKKNNKSGRNVDVKTPVVGMKSRKNGNVKASVMPNVKMDTIMPFIEANVCENSIIVTDEYNVYNKLHERFVHTTVNHKSKEFVNGVFHTNGIENFWSHFKRGIVGINHWVSREHLQAYVTEYTLRYNTRKFTTAGRFDLVLSNVAGRLTYKELIK